jgi:hypothetical protein
MRSAEPSPLLVRTAEASPLPRETRLVVRDGLREKDISFLLVVKPRHREERTMTLQRTESGRKVVGRGLAFAMGAAIAVLMPTSGLAQKAPVSQDNPLNDALSFCEIAVADMSGAGLTATGWTVGYASSYGPLNRSLSASKNGGDVQGNISIQPYTTMQLVYCTYDGSVGDADGARLQEAAEDHGLVGRVESDQNGTRGRWELLGDKEGMFVSAEMTADGYFVLELTWFAELPE